MMNLKYLSSMMNLKYPSSILSLLLVVVCLHISALANGGRQK
jgi:hypothetical protein